MSILFFLLYVLVCVFLFIYSFKVSLVVGMIISLIIILPNVFVLQKHMYKMRAVFSFGMITVTLFFGLGAYLRTVSVIFGPISTALGTILSFVSMIIYYFWKEGRRKIEYVVQYDAEEKANKKTNNGSFIQLIKGMPTHIRYMNNIFKRIQEYRKKGHSLNFCLQLVYVEELRKEQRKEPKNAIDFRILKEVKIDRNEYDKIGRKRPNR